MTIWNKQLEEITFAFSQLFDRIDRTSINFKPNADKWSVGEIMEHIILVNESYYPIFNELTADSYDPPFLSRFDFIVDLYGRMILKSVEPDRNKKYKTQAIWQPGKSEVNYDVLDRFFKSQLVLSKYMKELLPYALEEVVIHSPASKFIVYPINIALDIIISHEKRHLNQASEVVNSLKG